MDRLQIVGVKISCHMAGIDKIIQGNCKEVLKGLPDGFVSLTVTSPPYDSLRSYNGYSFDFEGIARELYRVTKDGGVIVWVVADQTVKGSKTGTSFEQALFFRDLGLNWHDTMIYQKPNFSNPSKTRYHQVFEFMFVFSKGKPVTFNPIKDRPNKYAGKVGSYGKNTVTQKDGSKKERPRKVNTEFGMRHNVWLMKTTGQTKSAGQIKHPAMFPNELARDHIISWTNENEIVLDPMCGAGTTCIEAKKLNRKYIGIDISEDYCNLAREELKKYE